MKRFLIMAAAMLAFMSCTKDIQEINQEIETEGTAFVAGQEVTIRCGNPQTKVSGTETGDKTISFLWEAGDKIKVTVGGESSTFTLVSGAGTKTATFTGTMPASGATFDIQYPETDPDLSSQTYSEGKLPAGKMKFTASDCTLDATATLTAAYAALRLNLYGIDRKVNSIVVTNTSSTADPKPSYTLTCTTPVTVGNTEETSISFLMVVPAGETAWAFSAQVTSAAVASPTYVLPDYPNCADKGIVVANGNFTASSAKAFTAGSVLDMPAKCLTTIWAPVNCGYDASHSYGLFYQWGRKAPCEYSESWTDGSGSHGAEQLLQTILPASFTSNINSKINDSDFNDYIYNTEIEPHDWYSNQYSDTPSDNKLLKAWPLTSGDEGYIANKIANPCPSGWRPPTFEELDRLVGGDGNGTGCATPTSFVSYNNMNGHWFNGSNTANKKKTGSDTEYEGIFLPTSGYRNYDTGLSYDRGQRGSYWSINVACQYAGRLDIWNSSISVGSSARSNGYSVRCVEE